MKKVLEIALSKVRGPFTSTTRTVAAPIKGPGLPSRGKGFGVSGEKGGDRKTIAGGTPDGRAVSPGGKSMSGGKTGGAGKLGDSKHGHDHAGNDNTTKRMIRTQKKVRVRFGKVMD